MRRSNDEAKSVENTFLILLLLTFLLSTQPLLCKGADVLNTTDTLIDGDTLISAGGAFELGFFSPGNSKNRYLGIWYRQITVITVVWVANREAPITNNTSGALLKVVSPGILLLLNSTNSIVWSSNASSSFAQVATSPIAQLLDSGNFVIKEGNDDNPDNYLWQSFDNPTDTLLAGMKMGHFPTGRENFLSSWKSSDDPGTGAYRYGLDPSGYPQAVLKKDSVEQYRTGPWNGAGYSGLPGLRENPFYTYDLFMSGNTTYYYYYELRNKSVITRFMMNESGITQRWSWIDRTQGWVLYLTAPTDNCDIYNQCGAHGSCDLLNSPICGCLGKFVPKFPEAWATADWSNGCVRRTSMKCETDGFVKYSQLKLPDARTSWYNRSMSLSECREVCLRNCSCTAYSSLDVRKGGSGCLIWYGDLLDLKKVNGAGQDLFIRMASSELEAENKKGKILIASLTSVGGLITVLGSLVMCWICRRRGGWWRIEENEELEVPFFELHRLSRATNGFSPSTEVGKGGFGTVFKGTLENGQDIAIKRLSTCTSLQGHNEFKNEAICIARHQHKNLVKLMGYCIHGKERMLIYEYLPNKSLDLFLFDDERSALLNWPVRCRIIIGIARGLMYLHRDCQIRIIHRDLKVSNILLDDDMNPKISDFGMAKIFGRNQTESTASKVVGTHGYMSPEYTSEGLFSTKSDVFSFGVMVLEIISGKRNNRRFTYRNHNQILLGHAWILHRDGRSMEMVQSSMRESCSTSEVLRLIHVGLLCVQASPEDRPSMSSVVTMLENDTLLPPPRLPGWFFAQENDSPVNDTSNLSSTQASSRNEISITDGFEPR